MRLNKAHLAGAGALLVAGSVAVNALWLQDGPHPAPMFTGERGFSPKWRWATDAGSGPVHYRPEQPTPTEIASAPTPVSPSVTIVPPPRPLPATRAAGHGDVVRQVQENLALIGFYTGEVDGIEGPKTRAAVEAYQNAAGMSPTGTVTEALRDHVLGVRARADARANARPDARPDAREAGEGRERQASTGVARTGERPRSSTAQGDPQIRAIQNILAGLGYAPGPVDGLYGAATREAIKRFEAERGMPVTGQITDPLVHELTRVSGTDIPSRG